MLILMMVTSEAAVSSLSGRALVLQHGHPLSPLLYPSLLLGKTYRDVTPASCECNAVKPGEKTDTTILPILCMPDCLNHDSI